MPGASPAGHTSRCCAADAGRSQTVRSARRRPRHSPSTGVPAGSRPHPARKKSRPGASHAGRHRSAVRPIAGSGAHSAGIPATAAADSARPDPGPDTPVPPPDIRRGHLRPGRTSQKNRRAQGQTRILTAWSVRPRSVSVSERLQSRRHRSALRTELSDRLLQDGLAVGFATPLFHVGQDASCRVRSSEGPEGSRGPYRRGNHNGGSPTHQGSEHRARSSEPLGACWRSRTRHESAGPPHHARPHPSGRHQRGCHGWHCHYPRKTPSA